jgi:hypothetical protein
VRSPKKRTLPQREKRSLLATPGLLATRYAPGGERALLRRHIEEGRAVRQRFADSLTDHTEACEGEEGVPSRCHAVAPFAATRDATR